MINIPSYDIAESRGPSVILCPLEQRRTVQNGNIRQYLYKHRFGLKRIKHNTNCMHYQVSSREIGKIGIVEFYDYTSSWYQSIFKIKEHRFAEAWIKRVHSGMCTKSEKAALLHICYSSCVLWWILVLALLSRYRFWILNLVMLVHQAVSRNNDDPVSCGMHVYYQVSNSQSF